MNESAAPLVDVPEASAESSDFPMVFFDEAPLVVSIDFGPVPTPDLAPTFDDLSDLLGIDGADAVQVGFQGSGARSASVQALLRFITQDCDRAVFTVTLDTLAREALLQEAVGRELSVAPDEVLFTPPPVRPVLELAPVVDERPAPEEAPSSEGPVASERVDEVTPVAPLPACDVAVEEQLEEDALADEPHLDAAEQDAEQAAVEAAAEAPAEAEVAAPSIDPDLPTEQTFADSFIADAELPHSRPWGQTEDGDRRVLALRHTLRSGKIVRFSGDVVVFGDINPGAQVVADGDIVVLGRLKGLAHAGRRGDTTAIVVGLDMQAGQVRIGDTIAFPSPVEPPSSSSRLAAILRRQPHLPQRSVSPSVARVVDGEIRIEDYRGRLHA